MNEEFENGLKWIVLGMLLIAALVCHAQTNTFPALQHFPGAPTNPCKATFLAQNDATDAMFTCDVNTLNWVQIGGAGATGFFGSFDRWAGYVSSNGNSPNTCLTGVSSITTQFGGSAVIVANTTFSGTATATEPSNCQVSTAASPQEAHFFLDNGTSENTGIVTELKIRARLVQTANSIFWVGFSSGVPASSSSDPFTLNAILFRCSSAVPDTNFQAYVANNSGASNVINTAVACDTSMHVFRITFSAGPTATFFIDGTQVASTATKVPAASANLLPGVFINNNGTSNAITFAVSYMFTKFSL